MELVSARCPVCGGEIQLDKDKETGFCLHCGSKIIVKDAINRIRIDNSHFIKNYYSILDTAIESKNFLEAENYANKILEIDSNDANAWFLKGKAIGWQSTFREIRISESISCWINTINCCDNDESCEKSDFLAKVTVEIISLTSSMIILFIDQFRSWPDMDVSQSIIFNLGDIKNSIQRFNSNIDLNIINIDDLFSSFLATINHLFIKIYKNVIEAEYKGDHNHPDDYDFSKYIERISASTYLLDNLLKFVDEEDPIREAYFKNLIKLHRYANNACSWQYSYSNGYGSYVRSKSLTKEAVSIREGLIADYEHELSKLREQKKLKEEKLKEQEQQNYWNNHPEEYKAYRINLTKIVQLRKKREELGFFKISDKKLIDEKIKVLENQIEELKHK